MTPTRTPLRDRIADREWRRAEADPTFVAGMARAAQEHERGEFQPFRPPWLRHLKARDDTGRLFS